MNLESYIAFASAMTLLILSPGPGLAAFLSRSMVSGAASGILVVLGMIIVDFLYLGLAIVGLSVIATYLGPLFQFVKYAAAIYLIWLGYQTIKSTRKPLPFQSRSKPSYIKDIGIGMVVTLGNPKAILFYGALLPSFFQVSEIQMADFLIMCVTITVVTFLVYGTYTVLTGHIKQAFNSDKLQRRVNYSTGGIYMGSGIFVALR
jgi:threonine/homoserine/homoserine lactone efflux protein